MKFESEQGLRMNMQDLENRSVASRAMTVKI